MARKPLNMRPGGVARNAESLTLEFRIPEAFENRLRRREQRIRAGDHCLASRSKGGRIVGCLCFVISATTRPPIEIAPSQISPNP